MTTRRPLVNVSGTLQELPTADELGDHSLKLNSPGAYGNVLYSAPNNDAASAARHASHLADFRGASGTDVGCIVFQGPVTNSAAQIQLHVLGGTLNSKETIDLTIQCQWNGATAYAFLKMISKGTLVPRVRMGRTSDGRHVLILGDTTTSWAWPTVSLVRGFFSIAGESNAKGWKALPLVTDDSVYSAVSDFSTALGALTTDTTGTATKTDGPPAIESNGTSSATTASRVVFALAAYRGNSTTTTGAIVFAAPSAASVMHRLRIALGQHASSRIASFSVRGWMNGTSWVNTEKVNDGMVDVQVRFGVTPDGKSCVILGDTTTVWSWPHAAITEALLGYTGVTDSYCQGWTASLVTDLSAYTNLTGTIPNTALATDISGNAATATSAGTSTTPTISATAGLTTTPSATWTVHKVGNAVTISTAAIVGTKDGTTGAITYGTLDASLRPAAARTVPVYTRADTAYQWGVATINTDGTIAVTQAPATSFAANGANAGIQGCSFSYNL